MVLLDNWRCCFSDPDDTRFVYDADGARIKRAHGDDATYYIGPIEVETDQGDVTETHSIYSLGGGVNVVRVVTSPGDDGEITFTFGDHLGSSSTVWQAGELGDTDPGVTSYQRYYPYGEPRDDYDSALPTDHTFTGQISDGLLDDGGTGLMYYRARYYDPQVGRFAAADTIIPDPANPQDLNRYTYVGNNPANGIDPSGHDPCRDEDGNPTNCPVSGKASEYGPGWVLTWFFSEDEIPSWLLSALSSDPAVMVIEHDGFVSIYVHKEPEAVRRAASMCPYAGGQCVALAYLLAGGDDPEVAAEIPSAMCTAQLADPSVGDFCDWGVAVPDPVGDLAIDLLAGGITAGGYKAYKSIAAWRAARQASSHVDEVLTSLQPGRRPHVRLTDDLAATFDDLTVDMVSTYLSKPGHLLVQLPDGTFVGIRSISSTAGGAIDVFKASGERIVVHLTGT
jgi:RHS repeat-associated protein